MNKVKSLTTALFVAALASPAIAAPVVGTTANGTLSTVCCGTPLNTSAVVGAGVEFTAPNGGLNSFFTADLSDTQIVLSLSTGLTIGIPSNVTWSFTLAPNLVFDSVSEVSDNFANGASVISFSGNAASFLISGQTHNSNQTFTAVYNIAVRDTAVVVPVPTPATAPLVLTALLGAAAASRRRAG